MRNPLLLLLVTAALAPCSASVAQSPLSAADSARADLPLIRRADAARTRGAGPASAIDTLRPTIHEFVDHACPSFRAFVMARGDSLTQLAATSRANLVLRVSPIPGLLRGAHAAEAAFCAGALGGAAAFDQLNRTLLEQQEAWRHRRDPAPEFRRLAVSAGLDSAQFERCLHSGAMRPLVMSDARLAGQLAVDGTPTLLVTRRNGAAQAVRVVGEAAPCRASLAP
jgi:protein-disulfide isomerase